MRKIPIALIIAAIFTAAVTVYITYTVNTGAPPVWSSAASGTINLVTPQTYFIYGTEYNRIADGISLATVAQLGSHLASISVNNTAYIPWIIVSESKFSGYVGSQAANTYDNIVYSVPMLLAMAYNESQISSMYGTNVTCVTINGTSVTLAVSPKAAPGYIALGWLLKGTQYGVTYGLEVEYVYTGKVVTANGFTWYLYLAAPFANAATGKISISNFGCTGSTPSVGGANEFTSVTTSGYTPEIVVTGTVGWTQAFTQVANVTASTTAVSVPAGSGTTIYGPGSNPMVLGVALPMEAYAFPVKNGPVQIAYSP
jgi:hypothetical protein